MKVSQTKNKMDLNSHWMHDTPLSVDFSETKLVPPVMIQRAILLEFWRRAKRGQ